MKKHKLKAIDYFKRHHRNECFITSDGRVFHNSGAARSFATSLKDDGIEHYTRAEVETDVKDTKNHQKTEEPKEITPPIITGEKKEGELNPEDTQKTEGQEDEKAKKTAELLSLELVSKNYNKMMSLVKFFGLETKDNKAESLIEALTEYKSKLED